MGLKNNRWNIRGQKFFYLMMIAIPVCAIHAQTLDGTWRTAQTMKDGNPTKTVYVFHQNGEQLTGKVEVAWGDLAIESGTIRNGNLSFLIHMGESEWTYDGHFSGTHLTLTVHDPNSAPESLEAERVTNDSAAPANIIPPPPLQTLRPNGLALTPPMGWNSWNHFQGRIDDATVRQVADALVHSGMRDAGYIYVNIDDTWEGQRGPDGALRPNVKFPDMKALAGYLHARGLKLGIYSSPGPETCAGYPGSYGHEQQDAATFASWGIDYLKYDWCSAFRLYSDHDMRAVYQRMAEALQRTKRPMVYSISAGGKDDVWTWGKLAGANIWRTTDDINASWKRIETIGFSQSSLASWSGPGAWNDPDMLEIGNGTLTPQEQRTHMSLWALLAAPLLTGNDVRSMDVETTAVLTNREVIAVDQDALGKQGTRVLTRGSIEVWKKPLSGNEVAVGIFNRADHAQTAETSWRTIGITHPSHARDLWKHKDIVLTSDTLRSEVPAHGVVLLRFRQ